MLEDENVPTTPDEPVVDERDDDVEGHSFRSRTRPDEQVGNGPGISGETGPDIDVVS